MSAQQPYDVGQKVHLLMTTGQVSTKRFEIVKVWRYPTTFRYLLDTGYVADHSELRASEGGEAAAEAAAPADAAAEDA
jgi:hypothetical protein